ncbi:MAG TPA: DUF1648 domain-containing protein [Cellulomonas sp.]
MTRPARRTTPRTPRRSAPVPHRRASTLLALVAPLVLLAVGAVVTLSWRDDLPDPVATHFSGAGPDGFTALVPFLAGMLALFGVLVVGCWALAWFVGQDGSTRRIAIGTAIWLGWFGAVLLTGTAWVQRGRTDATEAGDIAPVIAIGLYGGLALGALVAWLAVPGDARRPAGPGVPVEGPRIDLASSERAVWTRRQGSRVAVLIGGGGTLLVLGLTVALRMPSLMLLAVLLGALVLCTSVFVVTVDRAGLRVRSVLGWPGYAVPLDEVVRVETRPVRPLSSHGFGGWGYRVGTDGTVGVVLRTGPAIEVERTDGRRFVVTVDDADTGVALLATLADRARTAEPG